MERQGTESGDEKGEAERIKRKTWPKELQLNNKFKSISFILLSKLNNAQIVQQQYKIAVAAQKCVVFLLPLAFRPPLSLHFFSFTRFQQSQIAICSSQAKEQK